MVLLWWLTFALTKSLFSLSAKLLLCYHVGWTSPPSRSRLSPYYSIHRSYRATLFIWHIWMRALDKSIWDGVMLESCSRIVGCCYIQQSFVTPQKEVQFSVSCNVNLPRFAGGVQPNL